jgi:hypothetical protein
VGKRPSHSPYGPPEDAGKREDERPPSVGALTSDLLERAREHHAADRRASGPRSPIATALLILTVFCVVGCGVALAYGVYYFSDAPLRPSGQGYVGKTGAPRTREQFEEYLEWSLVMWTLFPATFAVAGLLAFTEARDRRNRRR